MPQDWITSTVQQWYDKLSLESEGTAKIYLSSLNTYWRHLKGQGFSTIDDWVAQVRQEQDSNDINVRRTWASSLEAFVNSYVGPRTGRLMVKQSKARTVSAIMNFLKRCLGDRLESYEFTYGTKAERLQELRAKEEVSPVTLDEIKALYAEAKNKRDRAILSSLMSGFGVSEWTQFATEWYKYANDIRQGKVPVRVVVTRVKTGISYSAFLWDDAVDDLKQLMDERERDLGRPLTKDDALFANQYGRQLDQHDVQKTIRRLAHFSGVEPRSKDKVSYRIRPHELGRDYFKTQASMAGIQNDVSEYLLGHKIDSLGYNKMHKTDEGKQLIQREASKLRHTLNIRTGKKAPFSALEDPRVITLETLAKALYPTDYNDIEIRVKEMAGRGALANEVVQFLNDEIARRQQTPASYQYERIPEDKADNHLNHGWEFVQVLPSGLLLVRRKKALSA